MKNRKEIKHEAKDLLKQHFLKLTFILSIIFITCWLITLIPVIGPIAQLIIGPVAIYVILTIVLGIYQENKLVTTDLMNGFKGNFYIKVLAFNALITLVSLFITFVSGYRLNSHLLGSSNLAISTIVLVIGVVLLCYINCSWMPVAFIAYLQPDKTIKETFMQSYAVMKGNRVSLLMLELSFLGWFFRLV